MVSTTRWPRLVWRPETSTSAPCWANSSAVSAPIPPSDPDPVINTVLPSSSGMVVLLIGEYWSTAQLPQVGRRISDHGNRDRRPGFDHGPDRSYLAGRPEARRRNRRPRSQPHRDSPVAVDRSANHEVIPCTVTAVALQHAAVLLRPEIGDRGMRGRVTRHGRADRGAVSQRAVPMLDPA